MVGSDYPKRVSAALRQDRPQDSIDSVKAVVSDELRALDPGARIHRTEYFNHSYLPDLVAAWPHDDSIADRFVYLRFNSDIENLIEDVDLVGEHHPIVFGLTDTPQPSNDNNLAVDLARISTDLDTLVTDAQGLEYLINRRESAFLRLVSSAVAQGGRGLVDKAAAIATAASLLNGFDGALVADAESTRSATGTISHLLSKQYSGRMQNLLQAVWVGAGGRIDSFPGASNIVGGISSEALQFLMAYEPPIQDAEFWRRIGRSVALNQLEQLSLPDGSPNLEAFMAANLHSFWARCCRVAEEAPRLSNEEESHIRWFVDRALIGLKVDTINAYISDRVEKLDNSVMTATGSGITVDELTRRAGDLFVNEAELSTGDKSIRFATKTGETLVDDDLLSRLADDLGPGALVRRIEVEFPDGRHLGCDFTTSTTSGRTRTKLGLSELLLTSVSLLAQVDEGVYADLPVRLGLTGIEDSGQLALEITDEPPF